jgi:hypothetical protein
MAVICSLNALSAGFRPQAVEFIRRFAEADIPYRIDETLRIADVQEAYWLQNRAPLDEVNAARKKAGCTF